MAHSLKLFLNLILMTGLALTLASCGDTEEEKAEKDLNRAEDLLDQREALFKEGLQMQMDLGSPSVDWDDKKLARLNYIAAKIDSIEVDLRSLDSPGKSCCEV